MKYDGDIFDAVEYGELEQVKMFWTDEIDVNWQDGAGMDLMMLACHHGHYEIAHHLLQFNPDLKQHNHAGLSAYDIAIQNGKWMTKQLLETHDPGIFKPGPQQLSMEQARALVQESLDAYNKDLADPVNWWHRPLEKHERVISLEAETVDAFIIACACRGWAEDKDPAYQGKGSSPYIIHKRNGQFLRAPFGFPIELVIEGFDHPDRVWRLCISPEALQSKASLNAVRKSLNASPAQILQWRKAQGMAALMEGPKFELVVRKRKMQEHGLMPELVLLWE